MEGSAGAGTVKELRLFFPSVILKELGVGDGVDVHILGGLSGGFSIRGVVVRDVSGMGEIEIF